MIHPRVREAFQEIDAAVFSGDSLEYDDFREHLKHFIQRWRKRLGETGCPNLDYLVEQYENGNLVV